MLDQLNLKDFLNLNNPSDHISTFSNVKSHLLYESVSNKLDVFISFVIPTYNRCKYLEEALESIVGLNNLEKINYEIIITDNSACLSDNNRSLKMIKEKDYSNLRYFVNEDNIGASGNLNRCIELARGKYVSMLLDDDLLDKQYLTVVLQCINYLTDKHIDFCGIKPNYTRFHEDDDLLEYPNYEHVFISPVTKTKCLFQGIGPSSCPTCGILFDRKRFLEVGGFYEELGPVGDYVVGYLMMDKGSIFYDIIEKTGYYRIANNLSTSKDTNLNFCKGDYYFREFMYTESFLRKLFGIVFRKVQYTESLKNLVINAKEFGVNLSVDEMAFDKNYGRCVIRTLLFKVLKKIHYIFFYRGRRIKINIRKES